MKFVAPIALAIILLQHCPGGAWAQTVVDPLRFVLPASAFPQAAEIIRSQTESNDQAIVDDPLRWSGAHPPAAGRVNGYLMEAVQANVGPWGNPHPVSTVYLVSLFSGSAGARAAFNEHAGAWKHVELYSPGGAKAAPLALSSKVGDRGLLGAFGATLASPEGGTRVFEDYFVRGAAFVEVWQYYRVQDFLPYGRAAKEWLLAIALRLDNDAITTYTPAGPASGASVSFFLRSVRAETANSPLDFARSRSPLSQVKVGAPVQLSAYISVDSAPPSAPVVARFSVRRGAHPVRRLLLYTHLNEKAAGQYRLRVPFAPQHAGTYTVSVSIAIGVAHKRGSVRFAAR